MGRVMSRVLAIALLASACAHGVSRPNPPAPPARRDVPYDGRVVLSAGALREHVEAFASAWTRRLSILGATAHITYDDDRAVFDLYGGGPAALDRVAAALADPGGWTLDGRALDGGLVVWLPPTPACQCSGRVRVSIDPTFLCALVDGDHVLARGGATTVLPGTIRWKARSFDKVIDLAQPDRSAGCPTKDVWPDSITFDLPMTASHEAQLAIVLGLAGGLLPEVPRLDAVTPARGQP